MVEEIKLKGEKIYECQECKMFYKNKKIAEKCEQWCRKNNSCNLLIIKHAIDINK